MPDVIDRLLLRALREVRREDPEQRSIGPEAIADRVGISRQEVVERLDHLAGIGRGSENSYRTQTLAWDAGHLRLLDQTRLPLEEVYLDLLDYRQVAEAIRSLRVRGAPALGCAAAYCVVLAALAFRDKTEEAFRIGLDSACSELLATRPTAVNIAWTLRRMRQVAEQEHDPHAAAERLLKEALAIQEEDVRANREMGRRGQVLIPDAYAVLTHCNAGSVALTASQPRTHCLAHLLVHIL